MPHVGILTFSDGRDFVHQGLIGFEDDVEARIVAMCEAAGYDVVRGTVPVTSNEVAVRRLGRSPPSGPT